MTKTSAKIIFGLVLASSLTAPAWAGSCTDKSENGAYISTASYSAPTIIGLASGSEDLSTLVTAVSAAGLADTLNSGGPFTVFAPTNVAFNALPAGTVSTLIKPENKKALANILTYHVVSGDIKAMDLIKAISDNGGRFSFPTVNGDTLTASISGKDVLLTDSNGGVSRITETDLEASNGVVHLIDRVVMPH